MEDATLFSEYCVTLVILMCLPGVHIVNHVAIDGLNEKIGWLDDSLE